MCLLAFCWAPTGLAVRRYPRNHTLFPCGARIQGQEPILVPRRRDQNSHSQRRQSRWSLDGPMAGFLLRYEPRYPQHHQQLANVQLPIPTQLNPTFYNWSWLHYLSLSPKFSCIMLDFGFRWFLNDLARYSGKSSLTRFNPLLSTQKILVDTLLVLKAYLFSWNFSSVNWLTYWTEISIEYNVDGHFVRV